MSSTIEKDLPPQAFEDEISLREIVSVLWNGKLLISAITTFFALTSIIVSLSLTNYYTSESLLISRDKQESGMSSLSGLASIAGVDLSSQGASLNKVIDIIQSREFVKRLITYDDVLPSIMAAKSYDTSTKKLSFDPELYNESSKTWVRDAPVNRDVIPSYIETHKEYSELLSITKDRLTGHVTIKIEHISPVFAYDFLSLVIQEANDVYREIDIDGANKALTYLNQELSGSPQVELKKSITNLMENQLETKMMASIHNDYVLMTLEPPFIPERKSGPVRSLIVILSTISGGLLSFMVVLFRRYY
tara:strand:- start:10542 stop:11456 length:915 start_codon:yes stop_codon:yes gene_type:complete